ncbi:hypothetical protein Droror1_Dr00014613 [Drosera rotundifolia]
MNNYSRMYKVVDRECNAVKKERDLLKCDLESRDEEYKNQQVLEIEIDSLNATINSQKSQIETLIKEKSDLEKELNVPEGDVEQLLVSLILDNRIQGHIDQVNRLLEGSDRKNK